MHLLVPSPGTLGEGEGSAFNDGWGWPYRIWSLAAHHGRISDMKVIIEKHPDGYIAYPLGLKGVVVGEGDTYEQALADVESAIQFHVETFGREVLENESPVIEAFIA